jgi:hypothetical protein
MEKVAEAEAGAAEAADSTGKLVPRRMILPLGTTRTGIMKMTRKQTITRL